MSEPMPGRGPGQDTDGWETAPRPEPEADRDGERPESDSRTLAAERVVPEGGAVAEPVTVTGPEDARAASGTSPAGAGGAEPGGYENAAADAAPEPDPVGGAEPDPRAAEPHGDAERSAPREDSESDSSARTPAAPRPLGVDVEPTGHDGVDTHLARLADADRLVVSEHPTVYEDVHDGLREVLAALDQSGEAPVAVGPGPRPGGPATGPRPAPPHPSSAPRPRS